jgi:hypothetical protein
MRTLNSSRVHATTTDRAGLRSVGSDHVAPRRASRRLIADAVIASYIRDISQHSPRSAEAPTDPPARPRRD